MYNEEKDQIGLRYYVLDAEEHSALLLANDRNVRPVIHQPDTRWKIWGIGVDIMGNDSIFSLTSSSPTYSISK
ncbi:hypothetical protein [Facklamia languida]